MRRTIPSVVRFNKHRTRPNKQESSHRNGRRRLTIWFFVCTVFLAWAVIQLLQQTEKIAEKQNELAQAELKLQQTTEMKQELEDEIERLHDPEYVEELARKEYYMTREGEIIFVDPR